MKNLNIKKIILTILMVQNFMAYAEESSIDSSVSQQVGQISVMPVIGATLMNINGLKSQGDDGLSSPTSKSGTAIGVLGGYQLEFLKSKFQAGIVYFESGTKQTANFFGFEVGALETTLSYLTIPISLSVPMGSLAATNFYGVAGMIPSFLTSAKISGTGVLEDTGSSNIKSSMNSFDLIGQLGIGGMNFINEAMSVNYELTYLNGFNKVSKDNGGYNQGFGLTVALAISI